MKLNKPVQKAKAPVESENLRQKEINEFTEAEFRRLKQRNLKIPVKLFHL